MKIYAFILVAFFTMAFSCGEECEDVRAACAVDDPVTELDWLAQEIAELESHKGSSTYKYFYVQKASYLGQTVFVFNNCCPFCNTRLLVYNCEGAEVAVENFSLLRDAAVIWSPDGFECEVP